MKKILITLAAIFCWVMTTAVFTACNNEDDNPVTLDTPRFNNMKEALGSLERVQDIKAVNIDNDINDRLLPAGTECYTFFFRQPVNHDNGSGSAFKQKACILFRGFDRPTIMGTCGYMLDSYRTHMDIANELGANILFVEHRNYGDSMNDDEHWDYQTSRQASADLHEIFSALKPILKGKWMSMGVSKSGETSIDYCSYYPNDMQLGVAFCSPFFTQLGDVSVSKYMLDECGTDEERAAMDAGIRRYLTDGEQGLYKAFCDSLKLADEEIPSYSEYVFNVFEIYFYAFSYNDRFTRGECMANATDDMHRLYQLWHTLLVANHIESWAYTYWIECVKEQGMYTHDYDRYADLLSGTSFDKEESMFYGIQAQDRWLIDHYDNSFRISLLDNFLPMTTTPTLFVYSKDDPWTAVRPKDINPITSKMFINPIGIHSNKLSDETIYSPELSKEIMDYIKLYIN